MAEENEVEDTPKKSKKVLIIIIIALLVLLLGGGAAAYLFLSGGSDGAEAKDADAQAAEVKAPAVYYEFKPPFIVTLTVNGKQRFLQIHLSAMARDAAALDVLETHMPLVRSRLLALYGEQDFLNMQSKAGKDHLLAESKRVINEILATEASDLEIEKALFTNFVMQ